MKDIVVVGAGKIGSMIAELLGGSGDYSVTVIDRSQQQLDRLETAVPVAKIAADITQGDALRKILAGKFAVLSAAPVMGSNTGMPSPAQSTNSFSPATCVCRIVGVMRLRQSLYRSQNQL